MATSSSNVLQLAITNIGDLLLQHKITNKGDNKPIDNIKLSIPIYQRPYKWTAKNIIQLLDDIINAKNENKEVYRVGTLILHLDKEGNYNIVDGQQRTISFSLLLTALGEKNIDFLYEKLPDNYDTRRNIANNFSALEKRFRAVKEDKDSKVIDNRQLVDLKRFIETQCELIVVITTDVSEAFQFFDSQNARGKSLYPHDLLKAYHLREMNDTEEAVTEKIVKDWEEMDQSHLSSLFGDYLYRVKEWLRGNKANELNEHNIDKFKGVNSKTKTPYAQYYKGAYAYSSMINNSAVPFVSGMRNLSSFQLDAPIVAGKPFFEYTKHYFEILKDIQNNSKYEGYFINDNVIVKTLDLPKYRNGVGNRITRLMFDVAALLYVDKFCQEHPRKLELEMFDQFVTYDFIWAYSLRAQYYSLGWASAQNYIMGEGGKEVVNSFNIYKQIVEADSPSSLLSELADKISSLRYAKIPANNKKDVDLWADEHNKVYANYLNYFKDNNFIIE